MLKQSIHKKNTCELETVKTLENLEELKKSHEALTSQFKKLKEVFLKLNNYCIDEFGHSKEVVGKISRNAEIKSKAKP